MARVLYLGNFSAPWCTEVHLARDMRYNGHEVIEFQAGAGMNDRTIRTIQRTARAHEIDLILWTRTIGWDLPQKATDELWGWAEARGITTASYHLDLYFGLNRQKETLAAEGEPETDPFWTTQHVFTPDGNGSSAKAFASRGINHHFMPPAIVSDECVPGQFREEYAHDVVFVGSRGYHPEWPWRRELIDGLRRHYGDRFAHYGGEGLPTVRSGLHNDELEDGLWLNDLYHSAKVVVGDTLNLPGNTMYVSDRYFEVMGRGGFLLAPHVPVLDDLGFIEGKHLYYYRDNDLSSVIERVEYMLGVDDIAAIGTAMRWDAQDFVRENHTYAHRLVAAFEIMGL